MSDVLVAKPEKVVEIAEGGVLKLDQSFKVMTYNVQFFAGRNYLFFFDLPDLSGPDYNVRLEDTERTTRGIAATILDEDPDFVLLQEVDDGARRTGYRDQLKYLIGFLDNKYPYYTSTFYWKFPFIPHRKIMGSVGIKLVILSKYRILKSESFSLPLPTNNIFLKPFIGQRAILRAEIECSHHNFYILNTHLDAFSLGSNVMEQQVNKISVLLDQMTKQGNAWVIGGDFNLLPAGQYEQLHNAQKKYYNPQTEIQELYRRFNVIPSTKQLEKNLADWYTFWGNDPSLSADRTLDYIIYSSNIVENYAAVRQKDTYELSDHFPVIASFGFQERKNA